MSNEIDNLVGEAKFGSDANTNRWANSGWNVKNGGVYRILPPFGSNRNNPKGWAVYERIHWGFKGTNGKMKPFRCLREYKNKKLTVECPICKKFYAKKDEYEDKYKKLKAEGKSKDEIATTLKSLKDWLDRYNVTSQWYVNALNVENKIGRLLIKVNAKKSLDVEIKSLVDEGINPINANDGVWFKFDKSGQDRDTIYTAKVFKEKIETGDGRRAEVIKPGNLSAAVLSRMKDEAFELKGMFKSITMQQAESLMSSGGDPNLVDTIFGGPTVSSVVEDSDDDFVPDDDEMNVSAKAETLSATEAESVMSLFD